MSDIFDDFKKVLKKDLVPILVQYFKDPNNKITDNLNDFLSEPQIFLKDFFKNFSKNKSKKSRYFPDEDFSKIALFENYKNIFLKPSKKEIDQNNRSRSAKLRYAIRSDNKFNYPNEFLEKFKKYLDLEGINV